MILKIIGIFIIFYIFSYPQTWIKVEGTTDQSYSVEVNPQNKNTIWFGHANSEIFISYDGGYKASDTIQTPEHLGELYPVTSIFIHPSDTNLVFATTFNGCFKSTDYGNTWNTYLPKDSAGSNGEAVINDPLHSDTIYVGILGIGKTFFRSYDRGETWDEFEMNGFSFCSITALEDGSILGGSLNSGLIIRSTDNGTTWDSVYATPPNSSYEIPKITYNPNQSENIWAAILAVANPLHGYLVESNDYGLTWTEVRTLGLEVNPWAIDIDRTERIIVGMFINGEKGAYISTDSGESWEIYSSGFPAEAARPLVWMVKSNGDSLGIFVCDSDLGAYKLNSTIVSVKNQEGIINAFNLNQNFPNPFNPTTTIKYSIRAEETKFATTTFVTLKVYDILGREIKTLVNEEKASGVYEAVFNAGNKLSSGIYFYRLEAGSFSEVKSMILIK